MHQLQNLFDVTNCENASMIATKIDENYPGYYFSDLPDEILYHIQSEQILAKNEDHEIAIEILDMRIEVIRQEYLKRLEKYGKITINELDMWRELAVMEIEPIHRIQERHQRTLRALLQPNNELRIDTARQYQITNILEFKNGTRSCIWHTDKTPSLHYYEKTNTVFCFGCSKSGDSIDVYMQEHKCNFVTAVKALS